MAFPTTGILDDFNRANEGPPPSASWVSTGIYDATPGVSVVSNTLADSGTFVGGAWGTQFGPDSEIFLTVTTLMDDGLELRLWLRGQQIGNSTTVDGYFIIFNRQDVLPGIRYRFIREDNGTGTQLGAFVDDTSGVLATGTKFGVDMSGSTITGYANRSGSWTTVDTRTDTTYSASGYIGLSTSSSAGRYDDFGGGTIGGAASPGAIGTFRTDRIRSRRTSW